MTMVIYDYGNQKNFIYNIPPNSKSDYTMEKLQDNAVASMLVRMKNSSVAKGRKKSGKKRSRSGKKRSNRKY
jgi:hypothetical protein